MNIKNIKKGSTHFVPVSLTIEFQTPKELAVFLAKVSINNMEPVKANLRQYAVWEDSPVKSEDLVKQDLIDISNKFGSIAEELGELSGMIKLGEK